MTDNRAAKRGIVLDFIQKRVWQPGDAGYDERMAEVEQIRKTHKTTTTGAIPPDRWAR